MAATEVVRDIRHDWLQCRIQSSLRINDDAFHKVLQGESSDAVSSFLDDPDVKSLMIYTEGKDLKAVNKPPAKYKSKCVYFIKHGNVNLDTDNMAQHVTALDMSENPLEQLKLMVEKIYLPLLNTSVNRQGLPKLVANEVTQRLHKHVTDISVMIGHTKGQTVLPLPVIADGENLAMQKKEKIHILENSVLTWSNQIKTELSADPDAPFTDSMSFPGPLTEVQFWTDRAANLNSIHEQITGTQIREVVAFLEGVQSTYCSSFQRLIADLEKKRAEANEISKLLKPAVRFFEKLNLMDEFSSLSALFRPIFHCILLIWCHSKFYGPERVVSLIKEICNDLIMQACKYLPGEELIQMEAQEAIDKLRAVMKVVAHLKKVYFEYKDKSKEQTPEKPWRFLNDVLFARLDAFYHRCAQMLELEITSLQFSKLERLEIGGTRGKTLTATTKSILSDFNKLLESFQRLEYNVLDASPDVFNADFTAFQTAVNKLERRLAAVILKAFDDCTAVIYSFKYLDLLEGLLDRKIVAQVVEHKLHEIVTRFGEDVQKVKIMYNQDKENPPINRNSPPYAGAVAWVRSLVERLTEPYNKVKGMQERFLTTATAQKILHECDDLLETMRAYEEAKIDTWCSNVESTSSAKLQQPVLDVDKIAMKETGLEILCVNFDPKLVLLLRETRYLISLKVDRIPNQAVLLFQQSEKFRHQIGNLDLIVAIWNKVLRTLIPVEKPLLDAKLSICKTLLTKGMNELTWNSNSLDEYIQEVMVAVKDVDTILSTVKSNVDEMREILSHWESSLLFERREPKTYTEKELKEAFHSCVTRRHKEIQDNGKQLVKLLSNSNRTLKVGKATASWKAYVNYISEIVISGFAASIVASLKYLETQLNTESILRLELRPLIKTELHLLTPEIVSKPELGDCGIGGMVTRWLNQFMEIGTLMKRLDIGEGNYSKELEEDYEIADHVSRILEIVSGSEIQCTAFTEQFLHYSYLWTLDLNTTLHTFLREHAEVLEDGSRDDPTLERFEEEITRYKEIEKEVEALPASKDIGWIQVDAKPLKSSLSTWASKWIYLFTHYLEEKVIYSMTDLYTFIENGNRVLDKEVKSPNQGDEAAENEEEKVAEKEEGTLYELMACMRDIRKRTDRTESMFEPLQRTVDLLKSFNITLDPEILKQLEDAPLAWKGVKKKMYQRREQIAPLQQSEAIEVRRRSDAFAERVETYRKVFLKMAPFSITGSELELTDLSTAYEMLDQFHHGSVSMVSEDGCSFETFDCLTKIRTESKQLQECQELFELYVSEYLMLQRCAEEMVYLKSIWDVASTILFTFNDWRKTHWDKIDVDILIEETKILGKEVKNLSKSVRNYDVYRLLEEKLKAMLTSLPLVQDLHHPAMRDRHWKQLMKATGKQFVMDENFCLGDLLDLELHNYVDSCSEIVDRAQKELIIEKALRKIEDTWSVLDLEFLTYQETDMLLVQVDDIVTEALENDNLQLQNMSGGKYVQGNAKFLEMVSNWQKKLGTVDVVLSTWLDVQTKWQALESIFIGSADIRVQLPEDSKRFDGINADFQDLMKNAPDVTNVVEACNLEGRQERLDALLEQLEMCEKALQDYLETKRIAFPRFYFVAAADLLDILSKGSNPQLILRHLPKTFDNVHNLEFNKDDNGEPTKIAVGMYSGEKEYVAFASDCICDGPVEAWLQTVVDSMREALHHEFTQAIPPYEEMPRTSWIFKYSAQNTIVVSRTFFTQEVNEAFDELEEGNEDALKNEYDKQVSQLSDLIDLINGKLTSLERKKLITLCTIDVHARDVVQRLIDERAEDVSCFQWQSQLRYYQNEKTKKCQVNICDAEIAYNNEYIGNCGCLCITPLTDRCYITLTQAQRLVLGGAPAGPAGTGKTETTKDLARALGIQCYVFNCSDQMDYKAMGQIYKGLAQTGAWGCFDEFNRIPVAVLSVCSTQYKTVLDAIRARKDRFLFEDVDISLRHSVMAFITMNPGYPGRAELPESLKALFRPVSMVLPDLALICEIMLMAEGFQMSKLLSRKFVILYKLCEDLLSKSKHYDWKLRAIKTTLYVAGGMKRAAPELSEDKVLLRALRDFNLGKLTSDDTGIFMGLLNDLFPKTLDLVPRAVDKTFDTRIREAAVELGYQPDDTFCLKISQLREIFEVRWSVFLLGPAGCGKTAIWRTLNRAQNNHGEKSIAKPINPKSVTRNELYGYLHPATREWKEGLMSVTFRDMANNSTNKHQWIVLDGDIDAEWIESMNTVMDDNKMLTLASNERIPLTPTMRLLLEINHMNHCSPATVSRGGVVFVNADDVGWKPAVDSWVAGIEAKEYQPLLTTLFAKYVDICLEYCRRNFKYVVQLPAVSQAMTICKILEGILPQESVRGAAPPDKRLLEHHFVFACIWAFGGCMLVDKVSDYRAQFSKWWISEWKTVPFPEKGVVFDYYVDEEQCLMVPWENRIQEFAYNPEADFNTLFVPTVETTRLTYFLDSLVANKHYVMFVGNTGTGKTAIMKNKLRNMDNEAALSYTINMNSFSDAPSLQAILEQPLEKKSGVRYGPPGSKRMVYFLDDLNMPFVDKYDTQSAIELARQFIDYKGWYDKVKIVLKEVINCQYCASMNPTAGSFQITPRMQRHFVTFAVQMPNTEIVKSIYQQIVDGHLSSFDSDVRNLGSKLIDATIELHSLVMNNFLPSAVKFHYQFNLRELTNITQGLTRMTKAAFQMPIKALRLWSYECDRVFRDRLVNESDMEIFDKFKSTVQKNVFMDYNLDELNKIPLIFASVANPSASEGVSIYDEVTSYDDLKRTLQEKLIEYNETNATMNLVLFRQAVEHICRIMRILDLPCGNVMLVGVGGSGKQSLARLASFICGYSVFQISVTSTYGIADFKENLLALYTKAGVKGMPVTFLITDNQIVNEKFLVYINDLLSTGYIADLCTPEDKDNFCNAVRNEAKAAGILDTPENLWDFFIQKVRKYLHVVLCFSPVGDKFRIRARQFPALVNCTQFDWFHEWPPEALLSVAQKFLTDIPDIDEPIRDKIALHMSFAHQEVTEASRRYLESYRRYNYTTPKSYLELISLYKQLLQRKRTELKTAKSRLENGVEKIAQASEQVADLQKALKEEQIIVEEKKAKTDELIVSIGQEKAVVDEAVESSRDDENQCATLQAEVQAFQAECERDLAAAEPVIKDAEAALNSLDKASLGELKSFGSPAAEVVQVVSACMVLTAPNGKIPKDLSWNAGKKFMGNVDAFLKSLVNFDKDNTPVNCVGVVERDYISNPNFNADYIKSKSGAASGLCSWVINICKYFRIYQVVAPKRAALAEANKKLDSANKKLTGIRAKVKELNQRVEDLERSLMKATEDKNNAIAQAEKTAKKAGLADRLINGLSGENKRWNEEIAKFEIQEGKLVGDVLLASAFVSYAGPFNMYFRTRLVEEKWLPDLLTRDIPISDNTKPLDMLADDRSKATWANEGLPSDPLSVENGAIITNASRWPLIIDPQLQGIKWIKNREEPNGLVIIQQSQPRYLDKVTNAIENGLPLLLENLPQDIDAVLDPVIQKATTKRGRNTIITIGDSEVEYDLNFRLYLQTKLSNPHYKPEIAAQTTLLNFCVTEKGLEDQLLAQVVDHERPDLQEQAQQLVRQLAQYTITLTELEDNLLLKLASSQGDILEDIELIENLEETKKTALDIEEKVRLGRETEIKISKAREVYRPVATRGSLVYFLVDNLNALDRVYHYSMANFVYVLKKGMAMTPGSKDESNVPEMNKLGREVDTNERVQLLIDTTTYVVFSYVAQGLFERHKLIVATQLCMAILKKRGELKMDKFEFLLKGPRIAGVDNPISEWIGESSWATVHALKELEDYSTLPDDLVGSAKRWREWMELERPEDEPLPGEWKRMGDFDQLLLFRALRPDRLSAAMTKFVTKIIGRHFVSSQPFDLELSFQDSSPGVPIFVFLSPGVDVAGSVEALGKKLDCTLDNDRYVSISLGQGQEPIAMKSLEHAHKNGGWVLLQNIHLTIDWTSGALEKKVDKLSEGAHPEFRLFLSAEPPPLLEKPLPISLLQNSIKLTNEPPEGLQANLRRAYGQFSEEILESCAKQAEFRTIVFSLCYFHAALLERKKFGVGNLPGARSGIGWNMNYPFNTGDLLCCGQCANNYLENNVKVPWDDLRYIFGEIMYGGHIVEDWDRRLANAYLYKYFNEQLLEGMDMFPGFPTPPNTLSHKQVLDYIGDSMPSETPLAFGLHPNAEIGFKLREAEAFCGNVSLLQPREAGGDGGLSIEERSKVVLDDLTERLPENFDLEDIRGRVDDYSPYVMVAIQETERMNALLSEMKRSLGELDLGLKGDLTISEPMEKLMLALANDAVPASWRNLAYPSLRPLGSWLNNLLQRINQLSDWTADLSVPKVVWLSGLFNPQSFLTAVMQTTARRNDWPLDKTVILTEITKKQPDQIEAASRDGAYIHGLTLEGARWDEKSGCLEESRPKQLFYSMPVILIKAVTVDKAEQKDAYQCPVYTTEARFREEVFTAQLKSKHSWIKWTLAGAALFLDVV